MMRMDGRPPCQSTKMGGWVGDQSCQAVCAAVITQSAASWSHDQLRCARRVGGITLASSIRSVLGEGLVPKGQVVLVATIYQIC